MKRYVPARPRRLLDWEFIRLSRALWQLKPKHRWTEIEYQDGRMRPDMAAELFVTHNPTELWVRKYQVMYAHCPVSLGHPFVPLSFYAGQVKRMLRSIGARFGWEVRRAREARDAE